MKQVPMVMLVEKTFRHIERDIIGWFKKEKILYESVETEEKAILVRAMVSAESLGCVNVAQNLCRGYDIKFAQDSFVIIVANGGKMKLHELEQIISRGSRS